MEYNWTDVAQAIGAMIGIPGALVALFILIKRDKNREMEIASLTSLASDSNLQTKNMNEQLGEMKTQTTNFEDSNSQYKINMFEDRFFNLLNQQQLILNSTEYEFTDSKGKFYHSKGRKVFGIIKDDFERIYKLLSKQINVLDMIDWHLILRLNGFKNTENKNGNISSKELEVLAIKENINLIFEAIDQKKYEEYEVKESYKLKECWKILFNYYHTFIAHYFRHLYNIIITLEIQEKLELLETESSFEKDKIKDRFKRYSDLIHSPMSTPEMFLLFYNCFEFTKTMELVKHYKLVENLAVEDLIDKDHKILYEPDVKLKSRKKLLSN